MFTFFHLHPAAASAAALSLFLHRAGFRFPIHHRSTYCGNQRHVCAVRQTAPASARNLFLSAERRTRPPSEGPLPRPRNSAGFGGGRRNTNCGRSSGRRPQQAQLAERASVPSLLSISVTSNAADEQKQLPRRPAVCFHLAMCAFGRPTYVRHRLGRQMTFMTFIKTLPFTSLPPF